MHSTFKKNSFAFKSYFKPNLSYFDRHYQFIKSTHIIKQCIVENTVDNSNNMLNMILSDGACDNTVLARTDKINIVVGKIDLSTASELFGIKGTLSDTGLSK